ncbi:MAG TPA: DUF3501 family protein [Candidatus Polarisedimenticolia bacterium]|nr:DUF3501 family protein [Candidatus Polarisedimenticolia bacterium]
MRKVSLDEVKDLAEYERVREEFRRRIIELKARRRVQVGDRVSLVFENHETALSQVQEMVRAERIVDREKIQFEIDTYNAILPEEGELSATLFIEITQEADIRKELDRLLGLDEPGRVYFDLGEAGRIPARFEAGHSDATRISAVHYVTFPFDPGQRRYLEEGPGPVRLVVDHPSYQAAGELTGTVRRALAEDFAEPAP